jgi:hypothetical protein
MTHHEGADQIAAGRAEGQVVSLGWREGHQVGDVAVTGAKLFGAAVGSWALMSTEATLAPLVASMTKADAVPEVPLW